MNHWPIVVASFPLLFLLGCSQHHVGTYDGQIQLVETKTETKKYPLADVQKQFDRYDESIELRADGRYIQQAGGRVHEGDWWIEGNKIGIRCDRQNGQRLGAGLISEGADFYFTIRGGDLVRGPYNEPGSNLEVVYVKR